MLVMCFKHGIIADNGVILQFVDTSKIIFSPKVLSSST